jgi:hypothetical protein
MGAWRLHPERRSAVFSARSALGALATGSAFAIVLACGDKATSPCQSPNLAGDYALDSITLVGQGTFSPPAATGALHLTTTTYVVDLTLPVVGAQHDSGTYSACNNGTWSQTSALAGTQSTGTFTLVGQELSVDVTTQGQQIKNYWTKH